MSKGLTGVRADHKTSYREIESLAAYVRRQLKFAPDAAINALQLFESLDDISIKTDAGSAIPLRYWVLDLEDSEGYARYNRSKQVLEVIASARTYEWLEQGHPRAAYFVAHELGHCIQHTDQLIRLAQLPANQQAAFHRGRLNHQPFEDTEWQANAFASALLMPARGIAAVERDYGYISAGLIVDQFGVSTEAARYRVECFRKRRNELLQ